MVAPTITSLASDLAALTARVAALETWHDQIVALAASREQRIANLEAYVQSNASKIAELDKSDEASGWKKWREAKP